MNRNKKEVWSKELDQLFEDELNKDILIDRLHRTYEQLYQPELNEKLLHTFKSKKTGDIHE